MRKGDIVFCPQNNALFLIVDTNEDHTIYEAEETAIKVATWSSILALTIGNSEIIGNIE